MDQIDLTVSQQERLEELQSRLESQAGSYATVTPQDTVDYLLDTAAAVDDPNPQSAERSPERSADTARQAFPEQSVREQLESRRLNHKDPDTADTMDLYTIAVEFDIDGRSSMQKAELIDAILATAKQQYTDPFGAVDIEFLSEQHTTSDVETEPTETTADNTDRDNTADSGTEQSSEEDDDGSGQLNAMLNLLETHDDKWQTTDGDARYEVELPDGSTESARTKDDIRAALFKHY